MFEETQAQRKTDAQMSFRSLFDKSALQSQPASRRRAASLTNRLTVSNHV
jgi:hypothetical protein